MNSIFEKQITIPHTDRTIPLVEIIGEKDGPAVLITAGIHGGESLGIRAVMRLIEYVRNENICGKLLICPCCNTDAFYLHLPYIVPEDGKNLLRVFPGDPHGSFSQKIAAFFTEQVFSSVDYYIDIHSGDIPEMLCPHVYYSALGDDKTTETSKSMAISTGLRFAVLSQGKNGSIQSAVQQNIPAILMEMGDSGLWNEDDAETYFHHICGVLSHLGVCNSPSIFSPSSHVSETFGVLAAFDGCWFPAIGPGDIVERGKRIGEIRDFLGKTLSVVYADFSGIVLYGRKALSVQKGDLLVYCGRTDSIKSGY